MCAMTADYPSQDKQFPKAMMPLRLKALGPLIIWKDAAIARLLRTFLNLSLSWPIVTIVNRKVRDALSDALRPNGLEE
jgi:hypothetical protein